MMGAACNDCGLHYEDFPIDVVLPDDEWAEICPEGGVLCAQCIARRASRLRDVVAVIRARLERVRAPLPGALDLEREALIASLKARLMMIAEVPPMSVGALTTIRIEAAGALADLDALMAREGVQS